MAESSSKSLPFQAMPRMPANVPIEGLEKVDFVEMMYRAIMTIVITNASIMNNAHMGPREKAIAFNTNVELLRALIYPLEDEEFKEKYREIVERHGDKASRDFVYGLEVLRQVMALLYRKGIVRPTIRMSGRPPAGGGLW